MNTTESPLAGFSPGHAQPAVPGIHLLYSVDKPTARVGETLTFTAWIVNSTDEALSEVSLSPRSFTNDHLEYLDYTAQPLHHELGGHTVGPQQTLHLTWSFTVTPSDGQAHGLLISALQARVSSPRFGPLISECDAYSRIEA